MIWRITTGVLALALAAAAVPALRHLRETPPPPVPAVRGAFEAPAGAELGAGDDILDAAISPDGRQVAFVATTRGVASLWRRSLDADRAEPLEGTDGATLPAWTGDGAEVSFFSGGQLRALSLRDGRVRDLATAPQPGGAAWLPDGSLLYSAAERGPIRRLQAGATTDATVLQSGDLTHRFPAAVGNAGDFLYMAQLTSGRRVLRLVRAGTQVELVRTSGAAFIVDDLLVHVVDGTLNAQRLDRASGIPTGRPVPLAYGVGIAPSGHAFFAVSSRVIVWASAAPRARDLAWFNLSGIRGQSLGDSSDAWQVRLAPDDSLAAVTALDPLLRTLDVFVRPAASGAMAPRRLSLSLSADSDPVWSPLGDRVAFRSMQGGQPNLYARPPQFSERPDDVMLRSELDETATDWRGDAAGGTILFHAPAAATRLDIWALDARDGARRPVAHGAFNESDCRWSPDGRWIAYVSDESGQPEVVVERWPQDGRQRRVTSAGGTHPRWRRDGQAIYFLRGTTLMQATADLRDADLVFDSAAPVADWPDVRDYDVAHLSDRLLAIVPAARAQPPKAAIIVGWAPPPAAQ